MHVCTWICLCAYICISLWWRRFLAVWSWRSKGECSPWKAVGCQPIPATAVKDWCRTLMLHEAALDSQWTLFCCLEEDKDLWRLNPEERELQQIRWNLYSYTAQVFGDVGCAQSCAVVTNQLFIFNKIVAISLLQHTQNLLSHLISG